MPSTASQILVGKLCTDKVFRAGFIASKYDYAYLAQEIQKTGLALLSGEDKGLERLTDPDVVKLAEQFNDKITKEDKSRGFDPCPNWPYC